MCRNKNVFRQEEAYSSLCMDLFRYYFAYWAKTAWGSVVPLVTKIYRSPTEVVVPTRHRPSIITSWVPPSMGFIKINMDKSFYSEVNRSGIGGIFCDHSGNMLMQFSKKVVIDYAILTEIQAIQ